MNLTVMGRVCYQTSQPGPDLLQSVLIDKLSDASTMNTFIPSHLGSTSHTHDRFVGGYQLPNLQTRKEDKGRSLQLRPDGIIVYSKENPSSAELFSSSKGKQESNKSSRAESNEAESTIHLISITQSILHDVSSSYDNIDYSLNSLCEFYLQRWAETSPRRKREKKTPVLPIGPQRGSTTHMQNLPYRVVSGSTSDICERIAPGEVRVQYREEKPEKREGINIWTMLRDLRLALVSDTLRSTASVGAQGLLYPSRRDWC